jgi:hypothetical protein
VFGWFTFVAIPQHCNPVLVRTTAVKGMEKINQKEMNRENKKEVEGNMQKKGNEVGGEGHSEEEKGISILQYLHIVQFH